MAGKDRKIRVLLARFPLEPHSRGMITVAAMLRDAGMEVTLVGNAMPQEIVRVAKQEKADVVGISSYCGGELALCSALFEAAEREGIKDRTVFLLGGIFPPGDAPTLKELGFSAVFSPSSTREEIVAAIESAVAGKR
ncbi:MAG: cobalamin-dependent protein [Dehalococcoidales bacterium]